MTKKFKEFRIDNSILESYLEEDISVDLYESKDDPTKIGGVSNNTKGVLHELLVGKFLNNGQPMDKHEDENKLSPQQVHDNLKAQIHPEDYKKIEAKAKSAAEDIRKNLTSSYPDHSIHEVVWTSKPGDTKKVTGVSASQKEDSSDIYVTTKHKKTGKLLHHGISLKVSDKPSKEVPSSSLGMKSSGSQAEALFRKHQQKIKQKYPELAGKIYSNSEKRKQWAQENPEKHAEIKKENYNLLKAVAESHAKELQQKIDSGNHKSVIDHLRDVLAAKTTPAEESGVATFQKHTTYVTAKGAQHNTSKPGQEYEGIFNDPSNIEVKSSGGSVHFYHKGKKFASQSQKFDSQSDPLSNLKSAGKSTGYKLATSPASTPSSKTGAPKQPYEVKIHG